MYALRDGEEGDEASRGAERIVGDDEEGDIVDELVGKLVEVHFGDGGFMADGCINKK